MSIAVVEVLNHKGRQVHTIAPDASVGDAVAALDQHGIGALVVTDTSGAVVGMLSERDVVRRLGADGAAVMERRVDEVMTTSVTTCEPEASIEDLMEVMTERRIRHLPIVVDGELVGLVSIGDVVKRRVAELRETADHLVDYVSGKY